VGILCHPPGITVQDGADSLLPFGPRISDFGLSPPHFFTVEAGNEFQSELLACSVLLCSTSKVRVVVTPDRRMAVGQIQT